MGHGKPLAHDLAAAYIDHHAARGTSVTPAVDRIGAARRGDIGRLAFAHCQAIQMAAVLVDQSRDEGWPPHLAKAVHRIGRGQTIHPGVDEDRFALGCHPDIMSIELPSDMNQSGCVAGIELAIGTLMGGKRVGEADQLMAGGKHHFLFADAGEAHGALHRALVQVEPAGRTTEQVEQPRLVGGEGERQIGSREQLDQPARMAVGCLAGHAVGPAWADAACRPADPRHNWRRMFIISVS